MTSQQKKVWLITGASSGLGREIAKAALGRGDQVIATARDPAKLVDLASDDCEILQLDINNTPEIIQEKADEALKLFGRVDVLVNNAALLLFGHLEELGYEGLKAQFDTVVFGTVKLINAFIPSMRAQQSGDIVVVGSRMAWHAATPMSGLYASSKAAIHALAETYSAELAAFKIRVLLVEPGSLRTDNITSAMTLSNSFPRQSLPFYAPSREQGFSRREKVHGNQPGDPAKTADAIVDVVRGEGAAKGRPWPSILALGKDARDGIRRKCQEVSKTLDEWADISEIEFD